MSLASELNTPISIDQPTDQSEDLISLDTGEPGTAPLSREVAAKRSQKAQYALTGKSVDQIYNDLVGGDEDKLRKEAASTVDFTRRLRKEQMLVDFSRQRKGPLSPEETKFLSNTFDKSVDSADPKSVFEEEFAKYYTAQIDRTANNNETFIPNAQNEIPKELEEEKGQISTLIAKREYAQTKKENSLEVLKNQSYFGTAIDTAKTLVPLYTDVKLRGQVEQVSKFNGLLGSNLEEQTQALLSLPLDQYKAKYDAIVSQLEKDNPHLAVMWSDAVLGHSTSDIFLQNMFTVMDVASLPITKITASAINKIGLLNATRQAAKDMVKSTASSEPSKVAMAGGAGDLKEAAIQKTASNVAADFSGEANPAKEAVEALTSHLRTDIGKFDENPGRFGQEIVNRLKDNYTNLIAKIADRLTNTLRVERIPFINTSEDAVRALEQEIRGQFSRSVDNTILDVSKPELNTVTNTYDYAIRFGKTDGTYFSSKAQAENFRTNYLQMEGIHGTSVEQNGLGWYLQVRKPLNETSDAVRDFLLTIKSVQTPDSLHSLWFNWLAKFRTPDEILSLEQRMNRKTSTYAPSVFLKVMKENSEDIQKLAKWALPGTAKKRKWEDWNRVLEASKSQIDPDTKLPGYFFRSPGELEDFYQLHIKRLPDQQEIAAYFSYVSNHEIDRVLRDIAVYRNKSREGVELHSFFAMNEAGVAKSRSPFFDGILQKTVPGGEDTVLVVHKNGDHKLYTANRFGNPVEKKELEELVNEGKYRVVKLHSASDRPLAELGGDIADARIRYVVSPNIETKPLPFQQVNRRGGGHFEYDHDWYVKQARVVPERIGTIFRHWYEGDSTIMAMSVRAMGRDVANKLDQVRQFIKAGKLDEAKKFVQDHLPMDWKEVHGWFKHSYALGGVKLPPRLGLEEPIQLVQRGKLIVDTDSALVNRYQGTFKDGTKQSQLDRVQFTGERDAHELYTMRNDGTKYNPLYKLEPAKMVDPIPTMDRALSRIANSTLLDDYKMFSVEHWLAEAAHPTRGVLHGSQDEIRAAPYYHFYNPRYLNGADAATKNLLEAQRSQILQLIGTPSATDRYLQRAAQSMADFVYNINPKLLSIKPLDPVWLIPKLSDPTRFFRAVTFHAKLGLLSVPQLWVQSQTYANIFAIAGLKYAVPGTKAASLHQLSRVNRNENILNALDKVASTKIIPGTSGWKPGEWKEALMEGERTGFFNVAGEYALRDTALTPQVIQHQGSQYLNAGAVFFTEGERNVRYGAWYTAFKEFRDKNPSGRLTTADRRAILERADMLNINMSRASSSALHSGVMAIPSQFLAYQLRMAELFIGNRIGWKERARILAWNAGLYGFPTAVGVTGFPAGDFIRKTALENGYVVGSGFDPQGSVRKISNEYIDYAVMEGIPSMVVKMASGEGDLATAEGLKKRFRTGSSYNFGDRFGTQGFETIREAMRSDTPWYKLLGGAAFSTFSGAYENTDGFTAAMMSMIRGYQSGDPKHFPFRAEDLVDPLREASSVNSTFRLLSALNTGKWLSKKGADLTTVSKESAWFMTALGLQPQEVADTALWAWSHKDVKDYQNYMQKKFMNEFDRYLTAMKDNNEDQAQDYLKRAFAKLVIGGFPPDKVPDLLAMAASNKEALIERVNSQNLIGKDVPRTNRYLGGLIETEAKDTRRDAFKRRYQLNEERSKP